MRAGIPTQTGRSRHGDLNRVSLVFQGSYGKSEGISRIEEREERREKKEGDTSRDGHLSIKGKEELFQSKQWGSTQSRHVRHS
eukprot:gene10516-7302_t